MKKQNAAQQHTSTPEILPPASNRKEKKHRGVVLEKEQKAAVVKVQTFTNAVDTFAKQLPTAQASFVRSHSEKIETLWIQAKTNILLIGSELLAIRDEIGVKQFAPFIRDVVPTLGGISWKSAYRYMLVASKHNGARALDDNPEARTALLQFGDGRGIIGVDENNNPTDELTNAAKEAFKAVPPPPKGSKQSEFGEWAQRFYTELRKHSNVGRKQSTGTIAKRIRSGYAALLSDYGKDGIRVAEKLVSQMTRALALAQKAEPGTRKEIVKAAMMATNGNGVAAAA